MAPERPDAFKRLVVRRQVLQQVLTERSSFRRRGGIPSAERFGQCSLFRVAWEKDFCDAVDAWDRCERILSSDENFRLQMLEAGVL